MEVKKINPNEVEVRCLTSDVRIEHRSEESAGRTITGYAAKFDSWSEPIMGWFVEQIRGGAFDECDISDAIMCFNHNIDDILARTSSSTLSLSVDEIGLKFSFEAPNTSRGNDVVEWVRRGDVNQCSFRFVVEQDEWLYADDKNGKKYDERTILKVSKLYDCALVVYPAYKDTEASVRRLEERKAAFLESLSPGVSDTKNESTAESDPEEHPSQGATQSDSRQRIVTLLKLQNK